MNNFGKNFNVQIFGESHGKGVGVLIDGVPPGISFAEDDMLPYLSRRRSGARGTTPRSEPDVPKILSGVYSGHTTGAPIMIVFENTNTRSKDYSALLRHPRPGHADFVAQQKYGGFQDYRGGGHFSGRITLGLVAAGSLARKLIAPAEVSSKILEIGGESDWTEVLESAIETHDSLGGIVEIQAAGLPIGLGEPFFASVEAQLAHAVFSVPAVRGIEFGAGFAAARMRGSEHNDLIVAADGTTATNHAAGINGGITNGNPVVFRVAIKPTSSIGMPQQTFNMESGKVEELLIEGRHDACITLRAPIVLESVTAITLADLVLTAKGTSPVG